MWVLSFYCMLKSEWIFMKNFANYNFLRSILPNKSLMSSTEKS